MKEYNWRQEREKYRAKPVEEAAQTAAPVEKVPQQEVSHRKISIGGIFSMILTVATILAIGSWCVVHYYLRDSSSRLASAAEIHKEAVGVVTMCFDFKNGQKVVVPLGTAWAFAPNKFATNAHVVSAIKGLYKNQIRTAALDLLALQAIEEKHASLQEYFQKKGSTKSKELIQNAEKEIASGILAVKVRININGVARKSYDVTHVGIHRSYGETNSNFNPDVAILTIQEQHHIFFKIASKKKLYALKAGKPIAFLGFPMENLSNNNINLSNPVASMQSGIIVAVSDFSLRDDGNANNVLIRHNLPATGGASGSPIFDTAGEVIALLYGGNMLQEKSNGTRMPSAAQINFAVRADLLEGVENPVETSVLFK